MAADYLELAALSVLEIERRRGLDTRLADPLAAPFVRSNSQAA